MRQCCVQAHVLFCKNDLRSVRAIRYYFNLFYHVLKRLVPSMSSEPRENFFFFFWGGGGGGGGVEGAGGVISHQAQRYLEK